MDELYQGMFSRVTSLAALLLSAGCINACADEDAGEGSVSSLETSSDAGSDVPRDVNAEFPREPATEISTDAGAEQARGFVAEQAPGAVAEQAGRAAIEQAGRSAAEQAGGSVTQPPEANNPNALRAAEVFAPEQVLEYRFRMPSAVAEELELHGNREEYVLSELTITGGSVGTIEFADVGLRHKGAWSLHHCWDAFGGERSFEEECARLSYKVKFDKFNDDARLFGLKRLNLHAGRSDPSLLKELLAYSTFNAFGVHAPRAAPAKVYINDEFVGVFVAVEAIDGRYTAFRNGASGDGNLYKETWPKPDLNDGYYEGALRTNDKAGGPFVGFPDGIPDVNDMQAFATAITATSADTFEEDMADWVSIDTLLRYMAVDRAAKNWDGVVSFYSPLTSHNFYWYKDNAPGSLFELIPWDMDTTFGYADPFLNPVEFGLDAEPVPGWNVQPASCEPVNVWALDSGLGVTPVGCDKLLGLLARTQWDAFREIGMQLLDGPLSADVVESKLDAWTALIEPAMQESEAQLERWTFGNGRARDQIPQANPDFLEYLQQDYRDESTQFTD